MLAIILLKVLVRFHIVLPELFDKILTHIRIVFLYFPGDLKLILGQYLRHLSTLSYQVEYELRDVSPSNRNVFDGDHIVLTAGNHMGHAVARVNDRARWFEDHDAARASTA